MEHTPKSYSDKYAPVRDYLPQCINNPDVLTEFIKFLLKGTHFCLYQNHPDYEEKKAEYDWYHRTLATITRVCEDLHQELANLVYKLVLADVWTNPNSETEPLHVAMAKVVSFHNLLVSKAGCERWGMISRPDGYQTYFVSPEPENHIFATMITYEIAEIKDGIMVWDKDFDREPLLHLADLVEQKDYLEFVRSDSAVPEEYTKIMQFITVFTKSVAFAPVISQKNAKVFLFKHPNFNIEVETFPAALLDVVRRFKCEVNQKCAYCDSRCNQNKCGKCKLVYYCNKNCQRAHWGNHKKVCHGESAKKIL